MPLANNDTLTSMTVLKRKWPFRAALLDDAPDTAGVYALWDNATLLYVGRANGGMEQGQGILPSSSASAPS